MANSLTRCVVFLMIGLFGGCAVEATESVGLSPVTTDYAPASPCQTQVLDPIRVVTANLTSGTQKPYTYEGPGIRMLRTMQPDIATLQECLFRKFTPRELEDEFGAPGDMETQEVLRFARTAPNANEQFRVLAFGPRKKSNPTVMFFFRGEPFFSEGATPNCIVSRYPIVDGGSWILEEKIQSIQQKTDIDTKRDVVILGGDLNTLSRDTQKETCLESLSQVFALGNAFPHDEQQVDATNSARLLSQGPSLHRPFDWILVNPTYDAFRYRNAMQVGPQSFENGYVFDTRLHSAAFLVANFPTVPRGLRARPEDSAAPNMQHMIVAKQFTVGELP